MTIFLMGAGGYVQVAANDLFSARGTDGRSLMCAVIGDKVKSGKVTSQGFVTEDSSVATLKAKVKKASAAKKPALKKKLALAQKKAKAHNQDCLREFNGESPPPAITPGSATPTPRPNATSTPRPTSTPGGSNGNASLGQQKFAALCQGCHSPASKRGRTQSQILASLNRPEMLSIQGQVSVQDAANIAAYLATQ